MLHGSRTALVTSLPVSAALLLSFVLSEGITRLLTDPPILEERSGRALWWDETLGFRGIPEARYEVGGPDGVHEVVLNEDGLRGRALPEASPEAQSSRIAVLGDDLMLGDALPVEALATTRIEQVLRDADPAAAVWNLSAHGWGTGQQLLYLQDIGARLAPDVVLLAFRLGNDVRDNDIELADPRARPGDRLRPYLTPSESGHRVEHLDGWTIGLLRHSRLLARLWAHLPPVGGNPPEIEDDRLGVDALLPPVLEPYREARLRPRWKSAWEKSLALIESLERECRALGAELIVVSLPSRIQVERPPGFARVDAEYGRLAGQPLLGTIDWEVPDRRLAAFLEAREIGHVALLDAFLEATADGTPTYLESEALSAEGHRIVADVAAQALPCRILPGCEAI